MFCGHSFAMFETVDVRNRFSLIALEDFAQERESIWMEWVPEISLSMNLDNEITLQGEYSMQGRFSNIWQNEAHTADITAESYRYWLRLSSPNTELRAGLQRLNFGTAQILRPLQWFDRINPLDINEETKGVEALLFRYYFLNNSNIWVWGLLADAETKDMELLPSEKGKIELGGRIQLPLPYAETGITFHHRELAGLTPAKNHEYRMGMDLRLDASLGIWFESSASHFTSATNLPLENQISGTAGVDYTFNLGNGLYSMLETNLTYYSTSEQDKLLNSSAMSALMLDYPLGLLDKLTLLFMYDYKAGKSLPSVVYRRVYDHLSIDLSLSHDLGQDFGGFGNRALQLTINYNI